MNALVTGATGFLGSHLCRRLVKEGYNLTVLCRSDSNSSLLDDLQIRRIIGDVTDEQAVEKAVDGNDVVIHAAAHLAYWGRQKDIQNKVNIEGTKNIVEACLKKGIKKLIHVSSVAAIGIPENGQAPANENFRFNLESSPLNYHISKKRAEELVQQAFERGLNAVIVNPGSIWGEFGDKFRGAEVAQKVRHNRLVAYFTGGLCVVHVEDVVEGILAALARGKSGERYILGGENVSQKTIAELAAREQNLERLFVPVPKAVTWLAAAVLESAAWVSRRRPRITFITHYNASRFHYYDSSKARKELQFSPRDFKTILNECLAFTEFQNGK
jgi:dihydroflavonol-4-reductase